MGELLEISKAKHAARVDGRPMHIVIEELKKKHPDMDTTLFEYYYHRERCRINKK